MKQILFTTLFISVFIPQLLSATIDDVRQALQDLDTLSISLQGKLHLHMNNQAETLRTQLSQMRSQTLQEIEDQIATVSSKITFLVQNTEDIGTNVETCLGTAQTDLDNFSSELKERLDECYGNMIMTGNSMLYAIWARAWDEYDITYQCNRMSFVQCSNYENATCANFVMNNIEDAGMKMVRTYDLLERDMTNEVTAMNFPCRQMIVEELVLYPSLILNFVNTCVESISTHAFINVRC